MANRLSYGFEEEEYNFQEGDEMDADEHDLESSFSMSEHDSPVGSVYPMAEQTRVRAGPITPTGRPLGYPLQSKRRRPLSELNRFSPYLPHSFEPKNSTWYEHTESQIHSLIDSQKKMVSMFEKISERIGDMEKAMTDMKTISPSSSGAISEEKKRIPTQISVSFS